MADILPALAPPVGGPSQLRPYWPDRIRQRLASAVVLKANSPSRPIELDSKEKPDIEYYPHDAKYINRTASRLAAAAATGVAIGPTSVPNGWPASLSGPRVWSGEQYENQSDYVHTLSSAEKEEINAALEHFNALSLLPQKSNRQTFDLPSLGPVLRRLSAELHDGRGFVVVRGLDPAHYDNEENLILYLGISSWVGDVRGRQDNTGSMLLHILDATQSASSAAAQLPTAFTNRAQPFHADIVCDILAMQCRSPPIRGGASLLASSWMIYNELAATRPDLIHILAADDWPCDTFGQDPAYYNRAPLHLLPAGKIALLFARPLLIGSQARPRTPGIPGISEAQAEALDAVHFLAAKHQLELKSRAGDLTYIHNLSVLHGRTSFQDGAFESEMRRSVRMWLRDDEKAWDLGDSGPLVDAWDRVYGKHEEIAENWEVDDQRTAECAARMTKSFRSCVD